MLNRLHHADRVIDAPRPELVPGRPRLGSGGSDMGILMWRLTHTTLRSAKPQTWTPSWLFMLQLQQE